MCHIGNKITMGCRDCSKMSLLAGHTVWAKLLWVVFLNPMRWTLENLCGVKLVNLWLWDCLGGAGGSC